MAEVDRQGDTDDPEPVKQQGLSWRRWVPLLVIAAVAAIVIANDWHRLLSLRTIADSRESLLAYVGDNRAMAIGLFMVIYAAVVAVSLPVGAVLTVMGGFLFGEITGGLIVVVSATMGATVIFMAARTALRDLMARRSGRIVEKMRKGFQDNALSYMLFLRLVPAFPFTLVNVAPAFLGVSLRTYVIGTFIGIIPGTFAYAFVGGGLDSILVKAQSDPAFQACMAKENAGMKPEGSCALGLDIGDLITTELIVAFVLLGVVALIPAIWRIARRKQVQDQ